MAAMNRIFISYAREDVSIATKLYRDLKTAGADPWLDSENLLPGQDWEFEITKALRDCTYFLAVISEHSVAKKGYVQKELRLALEILDELPPGKVYVIPARLDDSRPAHERLKKLHWVDLFPSYDDGLSKIKRSLRMGPVISSKSPPPISSTPKRRPMTADTPEYVAQEVSKDDALKVKPIALDFAEFEKNRNVFLYWEHISIQQFLDKIWVGFMRKYVQPNTYGISWVLVDDKTGNPIAYQGRHDSRNIAEAGIYPGMQLQAKQVYAKANKANEHGRTKG